MSIDARTRAWVTLALAGMPQAGLVELLRRFGSPEAVLAAQERSLVEFVGHDLTARLRKAPEPERLAATLAWLEPPGHRFVAWDDPDYPRALFDIGDAPAGLFALGRTDLFNRVSLAIVGSRHASAQGCDDARNFAHALAAAGVTIVSGLALGIDAAAHAGALAASTREAQSAGAGAAAAAPAGSGSGADAPGSTIAVVGTGLDRVYPARNRQLAHAIAERGALVSEFAPGTPPLKGNFPRRNRLISGLARGVLVVEATLQSGSLITARLAGEQGRDVFALPGSIHSPLARGCHKLIREGAKLTETVQDILVELGIAPAAETGAPATAPADPVQATLWAALSAAPTDLDRLVARTGLPAQTVAATLTVLELTGHAAALPGGLWQRRG
jgi:DNA processing protein